MNLMSLLFKRPSLPDVNIPEVDTTKLDRSLDLLKSTTQELSEAAVCTANALQERLRDAENRFYSTIDSVDDLVQIKDGEGRWRVLNGTGQDLFNVTPDDYFTKTDSDVIGIRPELTDVLCQCMVTDKEAWLNGSATRSEEIVPYHGRLRYFDVIKTPVFNDDGSRRELIIIGREITHEKERQSRIKACFSAINSASDIIFILDKNGNIFFINDMFINDFALESYEQAVGKHVTETLNIPKFNTIWKKVSSNKLWEGTYEGSPMSIMPMMNGADFPVYYICTIKTK